MYAVTVTFELVPGRFSAFMPLMQENANTSLATEPGCRRFDVCTDPSLPDTVFLYELYVNRAAFDTHLEASHFKEFDTAVSAMVARKTVICFSKVTS